MNRFRTKKKAGKDAPAHHGPSDPAPLPSLPFIKGKKKPAETKPQVDLSAALPSSDDFRTSLLMPKMSARFSMLRDQYDPNSKIGKANDDSVITPQRQSRLNLFGHSNNNQLSDIAEVSSVAGSARPSLADDRPSFASGEGPPVDDESVMNRSRPLEGNNLFGGRQKVYKIPVGGHKAEDDHTTNDDEAGAPDNGTAEAAAMGGKVVYENDVIMSAYQKRKQKEREEQERREAEEATLHLPAEGSAFSENKGSTDPIDPAQDTNQQPSASSTPADPQMTPASRQEQPNSDQHPAKQRPAATPESERNPSKPRRLYGQGLELRRQQSSAAMNRIEKVNRQRAATNDAVQIERSLSRSAVNLTEKFQQKTSPLYASSNFRPTSPPPSATSSISGHTDASAKNTNSGSGPGSSNVGHSYLTPVSPPVSEAGEISPFAADLRPEDRGKATATGLFNKPASKYDEAQFSQRQLMMYEGRNTPPLRPSPSRAHSGPETANRSRGHSSASYQSRDDSAPSRQSESAEETRRSGDRSASDSMRRFSPPKATSTNGTFLANLSGSESDDEAEAEDDRSVNSSVPSILHGSDSVHPALRTSTESGASSSYRSPHVSTPEIKQSDSRDLMTIEENETGENAPPPPPKDHDSPTLGPSTPAALGGLIRSHLRQGSDKSSVLPPPPSPGLAPASAEGNRERPDSSAQPSTRTPSHYAASVHSNPFEYDDWTKEPRTDSPEPSAPVKTQTTVQPDMSSMSTRAKQMLGQAAALSAQGADNQPGSEMNNTPYEPAAAGGSNSAAASQQEDAAASHNRAESSETQMDREEFANELAERRRKVQEKLRGIAETEPRPGTSGGPGQRFQDRGMGKSGGAALKPAASDKNGGVPKHLRVLGVDSTAASSSPNLPTKESSRDEDEKLPRQSGRQTPRSASPHVGSHNNNRPQQTHPHSPPPPRPQPTPQSSRDDVRESPTHDDASSSRPRKAEWKDRSGSESSDRPKSRPRHRDDLESVEETIDNQIRSLTGDEPSKAPQLPPPPHSVPSSARPSLDSSDRSHSGGHSVAATAGGGRLRSNSRSAAPSHLEVIPDSSSSSSMHGAHPPLIGTSPRPSPVTPYSANTTPPLFETSPNSSPASTPGTGMYGNASSHHNQTSSSQPPPPQPPQQQQQQQQRNQNQGGQGLAGHKRVVDKSKISEPKLVSSTNNAPVVGLPAGASLSNGSSSSPTPTPPIPPMNPRRRQTAAQSIRATFKGGSGSGSSDSRAGSRADSRADTMPPSSAGGGSRHMEEEHSTFSDEEKQPRPRARHRLRKISSEGGNLNARARQQASRAESPVVPPLPKKNGAMF